MNNIKEKRVTDLSIIMEMIDGKPYYSVQYRNAGEIGCHIGYSSYNLKTVLEFIDEYFEIVERDKQTNADRIRNMSDEELAEFLAVHDLALSGNDLPMLTDWFEWLQSEAEQE